MKESYKRIGLPAVLIAAVCVAVVAAHWPALSAGALMFDDQQYIMENILVQNPGWASAQRFFTEVFKPSTVRGYYQPLTMISLMLDYALGGREDNLLPFHRTSLALHAANTALVIVLLYLLFGNIWVASAAGLLFGFHPMTVEPVAWIGQRKALLAAFFAFWSLLFYVRFTRTGGKRYYASCLLAYLLALLSKPTSLPLPFVMLLMDYWPLNRLNRKAVLEKLPLFALIPVFAVVTLISQRLAAGALLPGQDHHSLQNPPLIICYNVVFYLSKMFWPANLSPRYPYPQPFAISNPSVLAGVVGTVILIALPVVSLRWTRAALTGWLIFFVTILPTMQIIKFTAVIASDNFVYLPSIGLSMILASFLLWLYKTKPRRAVSISIIVLLLAGAETVAVRRYLPYWTDTMTLYNYTLSLAPNFAPLHINLANTYGRLGRYEKAVEELKCAVTIDPCESNAYFNLGVAYSYLNRYQQAIDAFKEAIRLKPDYAEAYANLGFAYGALGQRDEEIGLGNLGRFDEAIKAYQQALKIRPKDAKVRFGLGLAYLKNGDPNSAMQQYEILKTLDPNMADRLRSLIYAPK